MLNNKCIKKILFSLTIVGVFIIVLFSLVMEQEKKIQLETKFPTLEIMVEDDVWPQEKEYHNATASMYFVDNSGNITNEDIQIRARGNSTIFYPKKPYKIKFDDRVYLMGDEASPARDWVLLANYIDLSMMRNFYTTKCMEMLENFLFVPKTMFVELIFNGSYIGIYQVYEEIEFNEARIDIDDSSNIAQNGFLIEKDNHPNGDEFYDHVYANGYSYNIKSDVHTEEQGRYLQKILVDVDNAIHFKDQAKIEQLIDVDSSIDMYLIYEFAKNIDVGHGSFYMYTYPGEEKLYFGPAWDFDTAYGNSVSLDDGSYEGLYVGNSSYDDWARHAWYQELMTQEWYQERVIKRWNEIKHIFLDALEEIKVFNRQYKDLFLKEQEVWTIDDKLEAHTVKPSFLDEFIMYDQHFDYLDNWIENRYVWLDNYFNTELMK